MEPTQQPLAFDTQGNLIIPGVHSGNYVAGSSGWTINEDGSAEFNNLTIRGGTSISGLDLYYNGAPASGSLVASLSSTAGVDQYGNHYLAGVTVYNWGVSYASLGNSSLTFGVFVGGQPDPNLANGATMDLAPGGLLLTSNVGGIGADAATTTLSPGSTGVTTPTGLEPYTLSVDAQASSVMSHHLSGAVVKTDIPGTAYKWQTPAYNANWAASTTFNTISGLESLHYRLDAEDNIVFHGCFAANAVTLPGTAVFNIANTAYRPVTQGGVFVMRNHGGVVTSGMALLTSGGNFDLFTQMGMPIALGDEYWVSGTLRLRNTP